MRLAEGVFRPPTAGITLGGSVFRFFPATVHIQEICKYAGAAVGSAVVSYPAHYAEDAEPEMGKEVRLTLGGVVIFRGILGHGPFEMSATRDEVLLVAYDDKWGMEANVIGQVGIGTQGDPAGSEGFKDVGFELIFNEDGRPNKDPSSRDFNTGSTAVFWELKDVLLLVLERYVSTDVVRITEEELDDGTAYEGVPSHLNLVGQTGLQAVDSVVQLTGESWGLVPTSSHSQFRRVRSGAGTVRTVHLFRPRWGSRVTEADIYYASACNVPKSIRQARDVYQAMSAPVIKETTYSSVGDDPLLIRRADFEDKKYAARFAVDVTKYAANDLGANLSAGSRPKPMKRDLLTRMKADGSDYLTKADIDANAALAANERVKKPFVWLSPADAVEGNARLVHGGMQLDVAAGTLDFEARVKLMKDAGEKPEEVTVANWANVGVWLTVATVLELPEYSETDAELKYLPQPFYQVIHKADLVPERRQNVWLPNLGDADNNAVTKILAGAEDEEEKYIDVGDRLDVAVAAAIAATPAIETPLELEFPFIPTFNPGDRITVAGRDVGVSGDEVVTEIKYNVHESYSTKVRASNVMAGVDPEQFLEVE